MTFTEDVGDNMIVCVTMRYGSKRLPGKALINFDGRNSVDILKEQLCSSENQVVFCCPHGPEGDPIVEYAESIGLTCFRGSLENVLDRMVSAAEHYNSESFIRVTGDDLFIDPVYMDKLAAVHECSDADISVSDLPKGTETIVIRTSFARGILSSYGNNTELWDRQRSDQWKDAKVELVPLSVVPVNEDTFALELDTPEDYEVIKEVLSRLVDAGIEQPYFIEELVELHECKRFPTSRDPVDRTYFSNA